MAFRELWLARGQSPVPFDPSLGFKLAIKYRLKSTIAICRTWSSTPRCIPCALHVMAIGQKEQMR